MSTGGCQPSVQEQEGKNTPLTIGQHCNSMDMGSITLPQDSMYPP